MTKLGTQEMQGYVNIQKLFKFHINRIKKKNKGLAQQMAEKSSAQIAYLIGKC